MLFCVIDSLLGGGATGGSCLSTADVPTAGTAGGRTGLAPGPTHARTESKKGCQMTGNVLTSCISAQDSRKVKNIKKIIVTGFEITCFQFRQHIASPVIYLRQQPGSQSRSDSVNDLILWHFCPRSSGPMTAVNGGEVKNYF
jgi:hypothetical protein